MVAFCLAVSLGVGHAYAAEFVVQSTETTHFPRISLTLTLPSAAGGQVPKAVKVWENGVELPGARIRLFDKYNFFQVRPRTLGCEVFNAAGERIYRRLGPLLLYLYDRPPVPAVFPAPADRAGV